MGLFSKPEPNQQTKPSQPVKPKLNFELLETEGLAATLRGSVYRAKIPGGWLVYMTGLASGSGPGPCFVPDPEHQWHGGSLP